MAKLIVAFRNFGARLKAVRNGTAVHVASEAQVKLMDVNVSSTVSCRRHLRPSILRRRLVLALRTAE